MPSPLPIAAGRGIPRHHVLHAPGTFGFDDVYDNFFPQASSQWDSLGHVGYAPDAFYNGASEEDVATGRRNTIDHWARHGIAGRGVVLDMVRTMAEAGRPYEPGTSTAFSVEDLELREGALGVDLPRRGHRAPPYRLCRLVRRTAPRRPDRAWPEP